MKYKLREGKKYGLPGQLEAFQYNGVLYGEPWITKAFNEGVLFWDEDEPGGYPRVLFLRVEEDEYNVDNGDYLIRRDSGEIEMCSKDVFESVYMKGDK